MKTLYKVEKEDFKTFQELTGDNNKLHYEDEYAKRTLFKGVIAPGMMIASLIEREFYVENKIKFRFVKEVRDNDLVSMIRDEKNKSAKIIKNYEDTVIEVEFGKEENFPGFSLDDALTYQRKITDDDFKKFTEILGIERLTFSVPKMYVASLIAPAMLRCLKQDEEYGIYKEQSLNFLREAKFDTPITTYALITKQKIMERIGAKKYELSAKCFQEGNLILLGKAICLVFPLEK